MTLASLVTGSPSILVRFTKADCTPARSGLCVRAHGLTSSRDACIYAHDRNRRRCKEVTSESVGATRSRTNRVMQKKGRIQACVHRLFLDSPGVASNGGV